MSSPGKPRRESGSCSCFKRRQRVKRAVQTTRHTYFTHCNRLGHTDRLTYRYRRFELIAFYIQVLTPTSKSECGSPEPLVSYVPREARRDDMHRTFLGTTDFHVALQQASWPDANTAVEPCFNNTVVRPEQRELLGLTCVIILSSFFSCFGAYLVPDVMPAEGLTRLVCFPCQHIA